MVGFCAFKNPPRSRTRGSIRQAKRGERGPQKKPGKVFISLRVEAGTVEAF